MKFTNIIKYSYLIICSVLSVILFMSLSDKKEYTIDLEFDGKNGYVQSPTPVLMYEYLEKYSDEYDIPKYIAYNIAYKETTYRGPFDWKYNPYRTSCVGALGPMQIMPSTSDWINKVEYSNGKIMMDIRLNIETSMKLLRKLHNQYGDWAKVCGCYNTGKPIINEYARYCSSNKNYKTKWLSLK